MLCDRVQLNFYQLFTIINMESINKGHIELLKKYLGVPSKEIRNAKQLDSELHAQRKIDYNTDDKSYGVAGRMSKLWGITSQKAGKYIKTHF